MLLRFTQSAKACTMVLLGLCMVLPAEAQDIKILTGVSTFEPVGVVGNEVSLSSLPEGTLASMSASWWKALRREHVRALASDDFATRAQALQNVIYFATFFPEQARMEAATSELYEIYRYEKDQRLRLMAVAAMHVIGREQTMRQLVNDARSETDPRIRRALTATVVDYFNKEKE